MNLKNKTFPVDCDNRNELCVGLLKKTLHLDQGCYFERAET